MWFIEYKVSAIAKINAIYSEKYIESKNEITKENKKLAW